MAERVFADAGGLRAVCARISGCVFSEEEWFAPRELAAVAQPVRSKRRRERLAARFLVKRLALELGIARAPTDVEIAAERSGRPFMTVSGERCAFDVSFSHSGDFAACAVATAPGVRLGVDVQTPDGRLGGLSRRFVSPGDASFIDAGFSDPLLMLWTLKEAASKCTGGGLSAGFANFACRLSLEAGADAAASRATCAVSGPCGFSGTGFTEPCPLQPGVMLAAVIRA